MTEPSQPVESRERVETAVGHAQPIPKRPKEIGGPKGPEPTRYGDWEKKGRCVDF